MKALQRTKSLSPKKWCVYVAYWIALILMDMIALDPLVLGLKSKNLTIMVGSAIISFIIMILTIYLTYKLYQRLTSCQKRFKLHLTHKQLGIAILTVLGTLVWQVFIIHPLMLVMGHSGISQNEQIIMKIASANHLAFFSIVIFAVILSPILEELLYRGVFIHLFFKHITWLAVLISSLIFALAHTTNSFLGFMTFFGSGIFLAIAYKYGKSIKVSITSHMIFNIISLFI